MKTMLSQNLLTTKTLPLALLADVVAVLLTSSSSTGTSTKDRPSFVMVVVSLLGAAMMVLKVALQRRHRGPLVRKSCVLASTNKSTDCSRQVVNDCPCWLPPTWLATRPSPVQRAQPNRSSLHWSGNRVCWLPPTRAPIPPVR